MSIPQAPAHARTGQMAHLTEEEKYHLEIYHDYDDQANNRKLNNFYGKVIAWQDDFIIKRIIGRSVLDVGAGYGLLTKALQARGVVVTGIEPNARARKFAHEWYGVDLLPVDIHATTFADGQFETAVLREVVDHLDIESTLRELKRIVSKEVLIFQTNLTWITRTARWLISHHEYNAQPVTYYVAQLRRAGFTIRRIDYHDLFAFPLSGGLLTKQWFPSNPSLQEFVIRWDDRLARLLETLRLARFLCWRYLIHATPNHRDEHG